MYFSLRNGSLMDSREVRKVALALGMRLKDDAAVRAFALGLPGVAYCVERPSVKYLATHDHLYDAVRLYYDSHKAQGITMKEARERVLALKEAWAQSGVQLTARGFEALPDEERAELIAAMHRLFCEEGKSLEEAAELLHVTEGLSRHLLQLWDDAHLSA